jgi:hypothetical protein
VALSMLASKSLASRRLRLSHASVRSTTQRRGSTTADSGHRDQPIRLIVITKTGDRDHAAHLVEEVPGVQHGVALVVTTDGCSVSFLPGVRQAA